MDGSHFDRLRAFAAAAPPPPCRPAARGRTWLSDGRPAPRPSPSGGAGARRRLEKSDQKSKAGVREGRIKAKADGTACSGSACQSGELRGSNLDHDGSRPAGPTDHSRLGSSDLGVRAPSQVCPALCPPSLVNNPKTTGHKEVPGEPVRKASPWLNAPRVCVEGWEPKPCAESACVCPPFRLQQHLPVYPLCVH